MKNVLIGFALILSAILLTHCATVRTPGGGPKDTTAPKLVRSVPLDGSLNFKGKIIEMEFDEPVQLDNIYKQLLITPYSKAKYTAVVRKNRLTIEFNDDFATNTTYTFNFRQAVKDVTEKNPAKKLKIAFSTGDSIDSLSIQGVVTELLTGKPVEDASVMLYRLEDTLNIQQPLYLAKTDKEGKYSLENLKQGEYQAFALKEEDGDLRFTKEDELFAFLSKPLTISKKGQNQSFKLEAFDTKELKFMKATTNGQYVDLEYSKPVASYQLTFPAGFASDSVRAIAKENIIRLYYRWQPTLIRPEKGTEEKRNSKETKNAPDLKVEGQTADSVQLIVRSTDALGYESKDTARILFSPARILKPDAFSVEYTPSNTKYLPGEEFDIVLSFNKPLSNYDLSQLKLIQSRDTTVTRMDKNNQEKTVKQKVSDTLALDLEREVSIDQTKLTIKKYTFQINNTIFLPKNSIISIEYDTLEPLNITYSLKKAEELGSLEGRVETDLNNFIVQLRDSEFKVEAEIANQKNFRFDYVKPGVKYLSVVIDTNKNGKWDKGDFRKQAVSEDIIFHSKRGIDIKPNWEILNEVIKVGGENLSTN